MSYCVVFVIRKRGTSLRKEFSAVPKSWVHGNQLYWPQKNLKALLKNPASEPDQTWTVSTCSQSRNDIGTYEEAVMWEQKFTEMDTEDEENAGNIVMFPPEAKPILNYDALFDDMESQATSEYLAPITSISVVPTPVAASPINCTSCVKQFEKVNATMNHVLGELTALRLILERIETNHLSLASHVPKAVAVDEQQIAFDTKFHFPLSNISELRALDSEITANARYKDYLINRFGKICGTEGNEKASDKLAYKLASEMLFTRKLLTEASWTGISRTTAVEQKFPFRTLRGILMAVETIMRNADSRWNMSDTDKLFREKLLKHARQRNDAFEKKKQDITVTVSDIVMEPEIEFLIFPDAVDAECI